MENLNSLYKWLDLEGVFVFDKRLPFSKKDSKATTLVHSILAKWSADTSDLLSRTESIVAILTGIPVAIFAGIQLLI